MQAKAAAVIGAGLLFVGVFAPLISVPIVGSVNYMMNGKGDGAVVLLMAIVAAGLALSGRVQHVLWPGLASLAMLAFTFFRFRSAMAEMRASMNAELAGNPFRGLADMAVNAVQIQWGWAVLLLGAILLIYAGWVSRQSAHRPEP